ncbi:MAG TPA: hypothetical protein VEA41_11275 [Salinarimonas sp.]|nr:hypothetical protein [Salinarimonas sp.]
MQDRDTMPAGAPITRGRMFEPLLAADPAFAPRWSAFLAEWGPEPEPPPLYLALADLATHLIGRLEAGDTAGFDAVFDVVERWHLEGDAYVREAATIGLLKDLQNEGFHRRTRPSDLERWLRPETRRWWDRVARFARDGTPVAPAG